MNRNANILLVEDNPNDLKLALHALRRHHLANKVFTARDGEEALDFLLRRGAHAGRSAEDDPHVILLDLKLPKITGLELLCAIKESPELRFIPVVVLTSSREESDLVASYESGANAYIVKPVDFEQFVEAMLVIGKYWLLLNELPANSNPNPENP